MRTLINVVALFILAWPVASTADVSDVNGTWLSGDGDGLIAVRVEGTRLSAKILGSRSNQEDRPTTDVHNPDPMLRNRPLIGLELFEGFRNEGDGEWSGGTIYDPNNGKTYSCKLKLIGPDTLNVRGFIGISLIGRSETWKRQPD
jgi:uncharacterized protein (DUF2147 family)